LASYQSIYHFAGSFSEVLRSPYDMMLPSLLDGQHDGSDIDQAMGTSVPYTLLRPEFLAAFKNDPNHPLRQVLRANDLYDWAPRAPMQMYHCGGDQDVLFANSQVAYNSFIRHGSTQVQLLGGSTDLDHGSCAPISLLAAKIWFDTLVVK